MEDFGIKNIKRYYMAGVYIFTFLVITGNIISCDRIRLFGVVLSAYRVMVPVLFSFFFYIRIKQKSWNQLLENHSLVLYLCLMVLWITWGTGLLFISPYSELREALKDILSLFLGMLSIYCFWELCDTEKIMDKIFNCIRIICIVLCIWALIEILFGLYLPFSKYYWLDLVEKEHWFAVLLKGLKDKSIYPTTTIFHNTNDFSAFLAIFLPLFYICKENTIKHNILRGIGFCLIVFIINVNDANIALIGITLSIIVYFIFGNKKYAGGLFATLLVILSFGSKIMVSLLAFLKSNIPVDVPVAAQKYGSIMDMIKIRQVYNVTEVLETQMTDAIGGSSNSLMCRWQITLTSLRMTLKSKLMGIGPSGFSNYIELNEKGSKLVDPHNWWLEILSQYGIVVFLAYFLTMTYIFFKVCKIYKVTQNRILLVYICMCITFCFACIAPSSYLNYTYQWILPAMGISLIGFWDRHLVHKT